MSKTINKYLPAAIIILVLASLWAILPVSTKLLGPDGLTLGLDLKGGSQLLYEADLSQKDPSVSDAEAMNAVAAKIQRRVNEFGVTEPTIQMMGTDKIIVQLPGVENITRAISLIGETGLLEFREQMFYENGTAMINETTGDLMFKNESATAIGTDGQEKTLTGKYLKRAYRAVDAYGVPVVSFEWNSEGAHLFQQITQRNLDKQLAIYVDNRLISAPVVKSVISDRGQIEGNFTLDYAGDLANMLNSGALDVPLALINQQDIDASLGSDSIRKSLIAAQIGIILLLMFMIAYYRFLGVMACISLGIYALFFLAILTLFPITLTLPGIAALILSLGMAVDANVLIFERTKEELRAKHPLSAAVEAGFSRAWPAIRDSNFTTFIACIILFWLGGTFGAFMVRGFALTLFIGVALSMFTAIIVTRTFLRFVVNNRLVTSLAAYGVKEQ